MNVGEKQLLGVVVLIRELLIGFFFLFYKSFFRTKDYCRKNKDFWLLFIILLKISSPELIFLLFYIALKKYKHKMILSIYLYCPYLSWQLEPNIFKWVFIILNKKSQLDNFPETFFFYTKRFVSSIIWKVIWICKYYSYLWQIDSMKWSLLVIVKLGSFFILGPYFWLHRK